MTTTAAPIAAGRSLATECPPWCRTAHRDQPCHYSETSTFGGRFEVELGRDPEVGQVVGLYLTDREPEDDLHSETLLEHFLVDDVGPVVEALQWARRTARGDGEALTNWNAALLLAADLEQFVEIVLTDKDLSDDQRQRILSGARDHLVELLSAERD
jgi:hypothetical protein